MKIRGVVIQNRNIFRNEFGEFMARYRGHNIYISDSHGFGKPEFEHLTRFTIDVTGKDGTYAVSTWEDCHNIKEAIGKALEGAELI